MILIDEKEMIRIRTYFHDPQKNLLHPSIIAATTIATILISLYYLSTGSFIVFQNLFYVPIIMSCMYYAMRGFIYSVCLAALYILMILVFTSDQGIITQALIRVVLFIAIAGIVTFLSTQRKRAEEATHRVEEKYHSIFENAVEGIFQTTPEGIFISANPAQAKLLGYDSPQELMEQITDIGRQHYVNPKEREIYKNTLERDGVIRGFETQLIKKDGNPVWTSISARAIKNNKETILYYEGTVEDITNRKESEEALNSSRNKLQTIFDSVYDAIFIHDVNGKIIDVNAKMLSMYQVKYDQALSFSVDTDYSSPDNPLDELHTIWEKVVGGESRSFYWIARRPIDGSVFPARVFLSRINLSGVDAVLASVTDISEHKRAEEALKESEERYRIAIEASSDGIAIVQNDVHVYVNQAFLDMFRYNALDEIIGQERYCIVHPDDYERVINYAQVRQRGEYAPIRYAFKGIRKDGTLIDIEVSVNTIFYKGEKAILAYLRDNTDRKLSEDKIKSLLSEKELLLKEVHHRIKNNMNTINGLLTLQAGTLKDPFAIAALKESGSRIRSMMTLYDKLYQSAGFNTISVRKYFPSLVDEIIANFPNSKSVKIEKKIDDFILDAKRLQPLGIIINELLTNIMKYAFTGKDDGSITVSATLAGNRVSLVIEDNGAGMPESINFENSPGFGLMLVGILTKQLEGTIQIERENGTRIILEFEV